MNKTIKWILAILGAVTVLVPIALSFKSALWMDPAVILVEMERIAEGYVPYKTMHLNYPPLWFYLMVGLKKLFNIPYACYSFYLVVHYLFSFVCAGLVYGISKEFGARTWISILVAWMFVMVSLWMYGDMVLFEIPSTAFGLLASFMALKCRHRAPIVFLFVGFLSSLPFLVKQFGAGYLFLVAYLIIAFCNSGRWKKFIWYFGGASIPIIICILIFGNSFLQSVIYNGYGGADFRALTGDTSTAFQRISSCVLYVCSRFPIIMVSLLLFPIIIKQNKWKEILFCFMGIGGFSMQFCFTGFNGMTITAWQFHYLLYILPFILLTIPVLFSLKLNRAFQGLLFSLLFIICAYSIYKVYRFNVYPLLTSNEKEEQQALTKKVCDIVQEGQTIWVMYGDLEFVYYLGNLYPADMANFGYSSGSFEITPEEAKKEMRMVDYVLAWEAGREFKTPGFYDQEVQDYLQGCAKEYLDEGGIVIYRTH